MTAANTKARTSTKQAPEAEPQTQTLTKSERDRLYAPNTSTVWVNYIKPIGDTKTGFSFPGRDTVKVLVDGEFKKFNNDGAWYDIWDSKSENNPDRLGNDFKSVLEEHGAVMVKLYWEWVSSQKQLLFVDTLNKRTGETFKKLYFKNEPKRRVVAYDIIKHGSSTPSKDAAVTDPQAYGADCDNQEQIPF